MKEKRVWKFFSIAEQEKEQAFLRQMHRCLLYTSDAADD